jgi:hypothetical protein
VEPGSARWQLEHPQRRAAAGLSISRVKLDEAELSGPPPPATMQAIPESVRRAVETRDRLLIPAPRAKPQNDLNTIEHNSKKGGMERKAKQVILCQITGAPGVIRTPDLLVRSQTLYPTELRAQYQQYSLA